MVSLLSYEFLGYLPYFSDERSVLVHKFLCISALFVFRKRGDPSVTSLEFKKLIGNKQSAIEDF